MTTFRLSKLAVSLAAAAALVFIAGGAVPLAAQNQSLTGTWNLTATGTPHGDLHFQAKFTHGAGKALTATVTLFDNPIAMTGEADAGAFRVSGEGGGGTLTLSGKLKSDGTLEGFLSNEQGDLLFTGKKAS
jgi:hypothetical protein